MLNPDYLLHISEGAEDIAEKLHNDIISRIVERIMLRIGRGDDYLLTAQDKWQIQTLQDAGYLLEDIQKDIVKATKLQQTEIKEAMEDAGVIAMEYDDRIYRDAGISEVAPVQLSPHMVRLMQRNYEATLGEWTNFTRTTADAAQQLFISELDRAYNLVSTGALSYTAAVREVIKTVASTGVVVTYPSGHKDTLETATMRAVRTGIAQATAQVQLARMEELEHDLVIVSSHMGARPSHAAWQGKIYSRTGKKYPNFAETTGYGTVTGLCGANCRHSFGPYFEGMENPYEQYDSEDNQKQYEKEQYQRTLERKIRKTKQENMALKKAVDECEDEKLKFELDMDYQKKSALLQRQNKAYKEYCERKELKPLSERLEVARWDRKQAAAARGAAKRYESAKSTIAKTDVDDYLDYKKRYQSNFEKLEKLEKETDDLLDQYMDAMDTPDEARFEKLHSKKYEELESFREVMKDLKAQLSGKEAKAVRHIEKNFANITGIPIDKVKMTGLPYDTAEMIYDSYDIVLNKFPELKGNLAKFTYDGVYGKAYASCNTLTGEIQAHGDFSNFESLIKKYADDVANGYHPIGTDHRSIIVHELGHALDGYMTKRRLLGADLNQFGIISTSSKAAKDMTLKMLGFDRQEIVNELKIQGLKTWERGAILEQREREFIAKHVSGYATGCDSDGNTTTDYPEREFFAECFAEYIMSDNPREAAKIFGEIINTALGR